MKDYNEYQLVIQLLIPQSFSYKEKYEKEGISLRILPYIIR